MNTSFIFRLEMTSQPQSRRSALRLRHMREERVGSQSKKGLSPVEERVANLLEEVLIEGDPNIQEAGVSCFEVPLGLGLS